MRTLVASLAIGIFLLFQFLSNAQWYWQKPSTQGNDKNKAVMINPDLQIAGSFESTYYVDQHHPQANDDNPGTESEPFLTVQKGLNTAGDRDTVYIKNGTYQLGGYSKDLSYSICILGENKDETILDSIGTLNIIGTVDSSIFTLKDLKFSNYAGTIFNLVVAEGDTLDGIHISDCIFDKVERTSKIRLFLGRYDVSPSGTVRNISILNCDYLGLTAPGVKYIYLYEGIISDIDISNNNFYDLHSNSETRGAVAIYVGNNSNLPFNRNVLISGNYIDTITAGTDGEIETHGILAYGDSLRILRNTVKEMNPGIDHEGIYMKGSYSVIADNVMINSTSNHGAISIKGGGKSFHDTIRNNRVQSSQEGRGLYSAGPENTTMEGNYVKSTYNGNHAGMYVYAANGSYCSMSNNYSESSGVSAYMHDVGGGHITWNTLISHAAGTIKLSGSTDSINIDNNTEYQGWPTDPPVSMASADVNEGNAPLTVSFSSNGSYDPNGFIHSFDWNFHDGTTSTEPNPSHTYTNARIYTATLIVTDADGFKDLSYVSIRVDKDDELVLMEEYQEENDISELNIHPNPCKKSTRIYFNLKNATALSVRVIDVHGRLISTVYSGTMPAGRKTLNWNGVDDMGKDIPSGIYLISLKTANCQEVRSLLKIY